MGVLHLHFKVGEHIFDAEGEQEVVERQLLIWRELIASLPSPPPARAQQGTGTAAGGPGGGDQSHDFSDYDKVFRHQGNVVSLTVLPTGQDREADAALLVMLGRKHYSGEDLVGGVRLLEGLSLSGLQVGRADRVFGTHGGPHVTRVGRNRGLKYRLTNLGIARAKEIARELAGSVA